MLKLDGSELSIFLIVITSLVSVRLHGQIVPSGNHVPTVTSTSVISTSTGTAGAPGSADGEDGLTDGTNGRALKKHSKYTILNTTGVSHVADTGHSVDRKITSTGVVTIEFGAGGLDGSTDGVGAAVRFRSPSGLAADSANNVYVADTGNSTVRKITSDGIVSTMVGVAGLTGAVDGNAMTTRFRHPRGVAADGEGNVYVADTYNHIIRKINSAGMVTTLAGALGLSGSVDGTGARARFSYPHGVAVDSSGTVFVADRRNNTIRKLKSNGVVTTLAGTAGEAGFANGNGLSAIFNKPSGVAVDELGNVYVADTGNDIIRKITPGGLVMTLAGTAGSSGFLNGSGAAARFNGPQAVTVDGSGDIYVADSNNLSVRKVTSAGVVTTLVASSSTKDAMHAPLQASLDTVLSLVYRNGVLCCTSANSVLCFPNL